MSDQLLLEKLRTFGMNINEEELRQKHRDFYAKARYKQFKCDWSIETEAALEAFVKSPSIHELLMQAAKDEVFDGIW